MGDRARVRRPLCAPVPQAVEDERHRVGRHRGVGQRDRGQQDVAIGRVVGAEVVDDAQPAGVGGAQLREPVGVGDALAGG
jgi:hypothetical protein